MGLGFDTYLETLIETKLGVSIELKSLTGAALEAFNKLHPRGAEGTRIGGQFVKKVEGMVGEAIHNIVESTPVKPGVRKILAKDVVKDTLTSSLTKLENIVDKIFKERDALKQFVTKNIMIGHPKAMKPEHIVHIRETIQDVYRRTGLKKLNSIDIKATVATQGEYQLNSSGIKTGTRELTILPSFPFDDLGGKIRYFEIKLAKAQNSIKENAKLLKSYKEVKNEVPANTREMKRFYEKRILQYQAVVQENLTHIKNLKEGKFVTDHSAFNMSNKYKAMVYHELGHQWHSDNEKIINKHLKYFSRDRKELCQTYGVTRRAKDNWHECMAENFTLYMAGIKEPLHPDMIRLFDKYIKP
jgi:hypothetical protein